MHDNMKVEIKAFFNRYVQFYKKSGKCLQNMISSFDFLNTILSIANKLVIFAYFFQSLLNSSRGSNTIKNTEFWFFFQQIV